MKITKIVYVQDGNECSFTNMNMRKPFAIETTLFVKDVGKAVKSSYFRHVVAEAVEKYRGNYIVMGMFKRLSSNRLISLKVEYLINPNNSTTLEQVVRG